MKLILSRKGFDSSSGGCPNPIFPNGEMLALPIPDPSSSITYKDIDFQGQAISCLVEHLSKGKVQGKAGAHLDPDLLECAYPRQIGWKPVLGQHGAAEGHLQNQLVGKGDLFLFFGLFNHVEKVNRKWQFVPSSRPMHVLWGWLSVESVIDLNDLETTVPECLHYHPHTAYQGEKNNRLYLAHEELAEGIQGSGVFRFDESLCLSDSESSKPSLWRLPEWFYPDQRAPLSYHSKPDRWKKGRHTCLLQSAARGQEFVLDTHLYPEAFPWVLELIGNYGQKSG